MGGIVPIGSTFLRIRRLLVYLVLTLVLMPVQALGLVFGRAWTATLPRFYHRLCCRILGLRVRRIGRPVTGRPVLFAANHVSYLDITVFSALITGVSFVAKSEVRSWPFFGWLARLQQTVFIDRQPRSTAAQRNAIAARLAARDALILFPEGTSGDGNRVLPFKSALFSVADTDGDPVTVQPVSIAYTRLDGMPIGRQFRPFFAWYGDMAMAPHLWTMLGLGTVEIVVEFHRPTTLAACGSRKELARYCQERCAFGLSTALSGRRRPPPEPAHAPGTEPETRPVAADGAAAALG